MAVEIVTPYKDLTIEEQLQGIVSSFDMTMDMICIDSSNDDLRCDTPYGCLKYATTSCAGVVRTIGLYLNILGVSYEHVHENEPVNQWCQIKVDGGYWIIDMYKYCGGWEPVPYKFQLIK